MGAVTLAAVSSAFVNAIVVVAATYLMVYHIDMVVYFIFKKIT